MRLRYTSKGRPRWLLLGLAALWLISSAVGVPAPVAANPETMLPPGQTTQSPPHVQAVTGLDTYQGIPVGLTADGQPFRGNPQAPLTLVEYSD